MKRTTEATKGIIYTGIALASILFGMLGVSSTPNQFHFGIILMVIIAVVMSFVCLGLAIKEARRSNKNEFDYRKELLGIKEEKTFIHINSPGQKTKSA